MVGLSVFTGGSESNKTLGQARKHWNVCAIVYTSSIDIGIKANGTRTSSTVTLTSSSNNSMP